VWPAGVMQACPGGGASGATARLLCAALIAAALLSACTSDVTPPPPPPRDTTPPSVSVIRPTDGLYDEDGDSLVDVRVVLSDSGGLVDPAAIRLRSLARVNGQADAATNLLDVWNVTTRDTGLLVVHETLEDLLHGGANALELTVPDTAGNITVDTIRFTLPHGVFLKTLVTGLGGLGHGVGIAVCPDDRRAYMTAGRSIVVVDTDALSVVATVRDPTAADDLKLPLCVPGDSLLWVTLRVERFDRRRLQWLPRVSGSFLSEGIIQSRRDSNLLYVGETTSGTIGLIDRVTATRTGYLLPFSPEDEYVFDLAVLPGDTKLYATRAIESGILVIDPESGQELTRIDVGGPTWPDNGRTDAIRLSSDDQILYAAVLDGDPRGVVAISTETDQVVKTLPLPEYVPQVLALNASGTRMFVTTQDRWQGIPSFNVLIDVPNWRVLAEFPRPRPAGAIRWDGGAAFRPDGKILFVGHNLDVDVYLIRE
jgi:DNA-binding beta-propeller fold protein YncE